MGETHMGRTKTIEDKEQADKAFREFMKQVEKEAVAEETRVYDRIKELVVRHYKENGWSHARLFGDQRSDYQNYDDWSLERVAAITQRIGDALSDKAYPAKDVPGSETADKSAIDTAKEFAGAFSGDYTLIIKRVIGMMSAILTQFASSSVASRNEVLRDTPLAGGLHLFFGCTGKVYDERSFFSHQFIGSFQIVFEAHISAEEARTVALQQILKTTELELQTLNEMITEIRLAQAKELRTLVSNPELWKSTKASYDEMLISLKASRQELVVEYDKYKSVTDAVDAHMDVLDLTAYGRPAPKDGGVPLDHLFIDGWELQLAQRYVAETLAS
jgi:ribosomal protein S21